MILVIYCVSFWGQETEFRQSHVVFCTLVMVLNGSSFSVSFKAQEAEFRQGHIVVFCTLVMGLS